LLNTCVFLISVFGIRILNYSESFFFPGRCFCCFSNNRHVRKYCEFQKMTVNWLVRLPGNGCSVHQKIKNVTDKKIDCKVKIINCVGISFFDYHLIKLQFKFKTCEKRSLFSPNNVTGNELAPNMLWSCLIVILISMFLSLHMMQIFKKTGISLISN